MGVWETIKLNQYENISMLEGVTIQLKGTHIHRGQRETHFIYVFDRRYKKLDKRLSPDMYSKVTFLVVQITLSPLILIRKSYSVTIPYEIVEYVV